MAQASSQTRLDALPDTSRLMLGAGLAWLAVVIFAAGNSIVSLLAEIGAEHRVMGRNVITYCNLLFVGSLIALPFWMLSMTTGRQNASTSREATMPMTPGCQSSLPSTIALRSSLA